MDSNVHVISYLTTELTMSIRMSLMMMRASTPTTRRVAMVTTAMIHGKLSSSQSVSGGTKVKG